MELWTNSDGTLVAELSTLEGNGQVRTAYGKTFIKLPNGSEILLESFAHAADRNADNEIEGWNITSAIDGSKYLIIND
jgi:hypothetical protein